MISNVLMPPYASADLVKAWLTIHASAVFGVPGFNWDARPQVLASTADSLDVLLCLGSFGVGNVQSCQTVRTLLAILESVAAAAGYRMPHLVFLDLMPCFATSASAFIAAGGGELYRKNLHQSSAEVVDISKAAQACADAATTALEQQGLRVMKIVLSPNVLACYRAAGCENGALPCFAVHPCSHYGDAVKVHAIVAGVQHLYAVRAMDDEKCCSVDEAVKASNICNRITMRAL